jgi:glycine dehydrogenase subunit 1
MPYISNTDAERLKMLKRIGVTQFSDLIKDIPDKFRLKKDLNLDSPLSEIEITKQIHEMTCNNLCAASANAFLGAGVYDHFIPAAIDTITSRPEFLTAYTPYQAEVSQGTLQYIYEYQTMICELTGMEIANASMYDGATAAAEAILLAVRKNKLMKAVIAGTIHPHFLQVIRCYTEGIGVEIVVVPSKNGQVDLDALKSAVDDTTACVLLQTPNFFGNLEDGFAVGEITHTQKKALFIVAVDPISLGILSSPAEYGADVVIGEGQALGNSMYFGGPLFGFFAAKMDLARMMPGRIVGASLDVDGKRAYCLTLQAREQHIRREKATSNICSNESLCSLAACVYMCLIGKNGLQEVAAQSTTKAHYLAKEICSIPGFEMAYPNVPFFKEFVIKTPMTAEKLIQRLLPNAIYAGVDMAPYGAPDQMMIAVTEKKSRVEMDELVIALKEVAHV